MGSKEKIVQAALETFAERGYHGTAVPQVAERAGVATGTIYRHFLSKEEMVNEVFRHAKRTLAELLVDGFDLKKTPREQFHEFWLRLARFARDFPVYFVFLELQDHKGYLDNESRAVELQVLAPVWSFCLNCRQQGVSKAMATEVLMAMIWGAFVGMFKAEAMGYCRLTEEDIAQGETAAWDMFAR